MNSQFLTTGLRPRAARPRAGSLGGVVVIGLIIGLALPGSASARLQTLHDHQRLLPARPSQRGNADQRKGSCRVPPGFPIDNSSVESGRSAGAAFAPGAAAGFELTYFFFQTNGVLDVETIRAHLQSATHQVGGYLDNSDGTEPLRFKIIVSDTVGVSDSVEAGLSLSADLFKVVKAEIELKYMHEWTQEHEFGQDVEVIVPAGQTCRLLAVAPIIRYTGDFTLNLGNTIFHLPDVYFDGPDTNPTPLAPADAPGPSAPAPGRAHVPARRRTSAQAPRPRSSPDGSPTMIGWRTGRRDRPGPRTVSAPSTAARGGRRTRARPPGCPRC